MSEQPRTKAETDPRRVEAESILNGALRRARDHRLDGTATFVEHHLRLVGLRSSKLGVGEAIDKIAEAFDTEMRAIDRDTALYPGRERRRAAVATQILRSARSRLLHARKGGNGATS